MANAAIVSDGLNALTISYDKCPISPPEGSTFPLTRETWRQELNIPIQIDMNPISAAAQLGFCIDSSKTDWARFYLPPDFRNVTISGEPYTDLYPKMCTSFGEKRATHIEVTNYNNAINKAYRKINNAISDKNRSTPFFISSLNLKDLKSSKLLDFSDEAQHSFVNLTKDKFMEIFQKSRDGLDTDEKENIISNTVYYFIIKLHVDPFFEIFINSYIKTHELINEFTKNPIGKGQLASFFSSAKIPKVDYEKYIETFGDNYAYSDEDKDHTGCGGPAITDSTGNISSKYMLQMLLPSTYNNDMSLHGNYKNLGFNWKEWSSGLGAIWPDLASLLGYKIVDSTINRTNRDLAAAVYIIGIIFPHAHEVGHIVPEYIMYIEREKNELNKKGDSIKNEVKKVEWKRKLEEKEVEWKSRLDALQSSININIKGSASDTIKAFRELISDAFAFLVVEFVIKKYIHVDFHKEILSKFFTFMCRSPFDGVHPEGRIRANSIKSNKYLYNILINKTTKNNTFSVITGPNNNTGDETSVSENLSSENFTNASNNNAPVKGNLYRSVNNVLKNGVISKKGTIKRRNQPIGSKNPIVSNVDGIAKGKNKTWRRERTGEQQFRNILAENPNIWNKRTKGWWLRGGGSRTRKCFIKSRI